MLASDKVSDIFLLLKKNAVNTFLIFNVQFSALIGRHIIT